MMEKLPSTITAGLPEKVRRKLTMRQIQPEFKYLPLQVLASIMTVLSPLRLFLSLLTYEHYRATSATPRLKLIDVAGLEEMPENLLKRIAHEWLVSVSKSRGEGSLKKYFEKADELCAQTIAQARISHAKAVRQAGAMRHLRNSADRMLRQTIKDSLLRKSRDRAVSPDSGLIVSEMPRHWLMDTFFRESGATRMVLPYATPWFRLWMYLHRKDAFWKRCVPKNYGVVRGADLLARIDEITVTSISMTPEELYDKCFIRTANITIHYGGNPPPVDSHVVNNIANHIQFPTPKNVPTVEGMRLLISRHELAKESMRMQHCVGWDGQSYSNYCDKGEMLIFALPKSTLAVWWPTGKVYQHQGLKRVNPPNSDRKLVYAWKHLLNETATKEKLAA